ncbi:MAG: hypothetical protein ACM3WV_12360 [Bacillota bacterium]
MNEWVKRNFHETTELTNQKIVKVTNLITMEGSLFSVIRARRPLLKSSDNLGDIIKQRDAFCRPLASTPEDAFGRIFGKYALTAANIAKYDVFHSLIIFNEHDPFAISREKIKDSLSIGMKWAHMVQKEDPSARYYILIWNCLWRSGASIVHGHMQVTLSRGIHFAKVESLRRSAYNYYKKYGTDYFLDLWSVHHGLGLAWSHDAAKGLVYLCPIKEKELFLIIPEYNEDLLADEIFFMLDCYRSMKVESFNLALYLKPLKAGEEEDWSHFPCIVRLVDRGLLENRTNDIGAMELYASSVISADPWDVMEALNNTAKNKQN